ncbi:MAG: S8 family serine peptidase [bacterium]|nr:S8 family serine peptidase [bacterium]
MRQTATKFFILLTAVFILISTIVFSGQTKKNMIQLKSRKFVAEKGIEKELRTRMRKCTKSHLHAFVKLKPRLRKKIAVPLRKRKPRKIKRFPITKGITVRSTTKRPRSMRALLKPAGITLLFQVQPGLWVAEIPKDTNLKDKKLIKRIQWMGAIRSEDKISSHLRQGRIYKWAREKKNKIRVSVSFFKHISRQEAERILKKFSHKIRRWEGLNGYDAIIPRKAVDKLAGEDAVKWIQQGPVPFMPFNNFTRKGLFVDEVQECDTGPVLAQYAGLTGAGIQVGVWDSGIDPDHGDFKTYDSAGTITGNRLQTTSSPFDMHGTLVAGVLGGNGFRCAPCGKTPYIFRGMAPEVEFQAYSPHPTWGASTNTFGIAINTMFMDVSNHSYLQGWNGRYTGTPARMDSIIRGDATTSSDEPIPPRPMIWAIGNNGRIPQYSSVEGYFSGEASSKNSLVVGGVAANLAMYDNRLMEDSSLGPTWDGRIKPDVMAPGDRVETCRMDTDCYSSGSGTSLAAPAVTGVACLMLQQYADTYGVNIDENPPLPSTIKALLIQSATDLIHDTADDSDIDNPDTGAPVLYHRGPDYATGYGVINALAATALIKEKNIIEDSIATRTEVDEFEFHVPPGTDKIQFTLAWDDEPDPDTYGAETEPRLVNDLDMVLLGPALIHYPWILAPLTPAVNAGDPDPITAADITPATRGEDHLNNVEQVTVDNPLPGRWRVRVGLFDDSPGELETEQRYSLTGNFHQDFYFCDWNETTGSVYHINGGAPEVIYTALAGRVYHSVFDSDGILYVSNSNTRTIEKISGGDQGDEVVYTHDTYSRDIAFDHQGRFYFSEATGAGGDGVIYRLDLDTSAVSVFYRVRLDQMNGSWAGDFCFDSDGLLYLSSGNRIGSHIYRVDNPVGASVPVSIYYISTEAVCGIAFNRSGDFFYTNWSGSRGNIFRLTLSDGQRTLVHSFPDRYIWDVSFK